MVVIGRVRSPQVSHFDGAISKWGMTSKCRTAAGNFREHGARRDCPLPSRSPFLLWSLALERHRRQTGMVFVGFETDRIDVEEPSIHIWPSGALGVWPPTNVNHVASCCPPAHARLYRPPWQMRRSTQL